MIERESVCVSERVREEKDRTGTDPFVCKSANRSQTCEQQAGTYRGLTHYKVPSLFVEANAKFVASRKKLVGS